MSSLASLGAKCGMPSPRLEGRQRRRGVVPAAKAQRKPQKSLSKPDSKGFGSSQLQQPESINTEAPTESAAQSSAAAAPQQQLASTAGAALDSAGTSSSSSSSGVADALPPVSRGQVLAACAQVSLLLAAFGYGLHEVASIISPAVREGNGDAVRALLQWPPLPSLQQLGIALEAAAGVTAARVALLTAWPEFKEASDRSNQQALGPLAIGDLLVVSALPGLSEELLFRGALIPAISPDWRGVLIAGVVFGALHSSGGRNAAFAAWASAVGCLYGFLFISTGSLWVPALAHSAANLASAGIWKARHSCIW